MNENKVKIFFEDMVYNTDYSLLEIGKDEDELKEIAIKKGLVVPSKDLAIFKGRYALVDKENKNKCTLPKKEVKKALKTLNGKAVDKDHLRASVVGHWLDAELDGDEIITYAVFFKSNFPDDYDTFKEKMATGKMKISFEAWGEREFKENGSYDLKNIEFAGGALLFETRPAEPTAEVLEMSNRVLEFAKIVDDKEVELDSGSSNKIEGDIMEEAKLNFYYDTNTIARLMYEGKCPSCDTQGWFDVNNINFDEGQLEVTCGGCGAKSKMNLTPQMTLVKKGKKIEKSTQDNSETASKIQEEKGGEKVMEEILKRYSKATIEEVVSFLEKEVETVKASLTAKDTELSNVKTELDIVKASAKETKDALDTRIAAEKAAIVTARKTELGPELSKDISDEDILNDIKFENLKLKKEIATLKAKEPEKAGLEAGAHTEIKDPIDTKRESIQEKAFPKESK